MNTTNNSIAVITGAAGGMGLPTAVRLAAQGWNLLLCDIDPTKLEAVAAPLRETGVTVEVLAGDIAQEDYPAQLLSALADRQIGALVHTAGVSPTYGDVAGIFAINFLATERLLGAVLPKMAAGSCAVLISSSSAYMMNSAEFITATNALLAGDVATATEFASSPQLAYPLSKRAVIQLVAQQATAFGARKARIASIAPGLIDTGMSQAEMATSERMKEMLARTPLGRLGQGDEIASVAAFLCSEEAAYISGCDIKVDGGMLAALGV